MDQQEKAIELFDQGLSVGKVAKELGITPYKAAKLKPGADGEAEASGEAETQNDWDVSISIPADNLDALLRTVSADELVRAVRELDSQGKANLLAAVLQRRVNEAL